MAPCWDCVTPFEVQTGKNWPYHLVLGRDDLTRLPRRSILTRREPSSPETIALDLKFIWLQYMTGGLLECDPELSAPRNSTESLRQLDATVEPMSPRQCRLAHTLRWRKSPLQHCLDCGAQRTYVLQPNLQIGRWERPQVDSARRLQVVFSSSMGTVRYPSS